MLVSNSDICLSASPVLQLKVCATMFGSLSFKDISNMQDLSVLCSVYLLLGKYNEIKKHLQRNNIKFQLNEWVIRRSARKKVKFWCNEEHPPAESKCSQRVYTFFFRERIIIKRKREESKRFLRNSKVTLSTLHWRAKDSRRMKALRKQPE